MKKEIRELTDVLPILEDFDKGIFGDEKLIEPSERQLLMEIGGTAVMAYNADILVGAAYFVPSQGVSDFFSEFDKGFVGSEDALYLYSIAVNKKWHNNGIGSELVAKAMDIGREDGYEYGLAHTETGNEHEPHVRRMLRALSSREVPDFYGTNKHAVCLTFPFH